MGDTVQQVLEDMVPELEELQDRGIFNRDEIRAIVRRRRQFEYSMARRAPRKVDALRYASYELRLDALRAARKSKMGLRGHMISNHAGVRRLHFIFSRALRRFKADVRMWLHYLDFCRRTGSNAVIPKTFARALQYHPRSAALWVQAAAWEFESNRNAENARVLLQRAIRTNRRSARLWLEYFRLELLCLERAGPLDERTSGGADGAGAGGSEAVAEGEDGAAAESDGEGEGEGESEGEGERTKAARLRSGREELASGALPVLVFDSCVEALGGLSGAAGNAGVGAFDGDGSEGGATLELHSRFLAIADGFPAPFAARARARIVRSIRKRFGDAEEALAVLAQRPLARAGLQLSGGAAAGDAPASCAALRECLDLFERALRRRPTRLMWTLALDFYERALVRWGAAAPHAEAKAQTQAEVEVAVHAPLASRLRRCALAGGSTGHAASETLGLFEAALAESPAKSALLGMLLDAAAAGHVPFGGAETLFLRTAGAMVHPEPEYAPALVGAFARLELLRRDAGAARSAYEHALRAFASDVQVRIACLRQCVDAERARLAPDAGVLRRLYARLLEGGGGAADASAWRELIALERAAGEHERANQLHETGAPFGDILDAGTGDHSLQWLMRLHDQGASSVTAITADPTSRARLERNVAGGAQFNCVIADYLLGAIECFSPYRQAILFRRLRPMLAPSASSRLYVVGLEPFYHATSGVPASAYAGDAAVARRARNLLMSIVRLRDAAITLAGHTPHREYPLSWVRQALHDAGFEVKGTRSFGNVYGEQALLRMLHTAELKLPFISGENRGAQDAGDGALAAALRAQIGVLRERVRSFVSAHGAVSMGFDYVVEACISA
eukprot:g4709.t1